ncbi:THUMP domain-containing protein 1 homolog [Teleopsis dalmanni]|uniref:THUMP domain-containing protein 1 homolog n=1 Tax=Teleopsis dalmanni TaxID=139649 RepID=UPI0018CE8846|nr:THUMP domain-containing protein 1 homolog [Teleopsis dalmanni]
MGDEPSNKKLKVSSNNFKHYFKNQKKKYCLEIGSRGFLATCNFKTKECIRECYNILNHYADELYGTEDGVKLNEDEQSEKIGDDIADCLQKEISVTKDKDQQQKRCRFQAVDTGASNCIFIRTTVANPIELGAHIAMDLKEKGAQKCRFLQRLVPIEIVCRANLKDILSAAGKLFDKYFLKESCTFAISFNRRFNNSIDRDETIRELAVLIQSKNAKNQVDLKFALKTVIVEIIKGLCCLSVIENYYKLRKYNLIELTKLSENVNSEEHTSIDSNNIKESTNESVSTV